MMMSAGAGAARPTGSSTTIAKIPRHRHRCLGLARATHRSDRSGAALTGFVTLRARARGGAMPTDLLDLLEPPWRCSGIRAEADAVGRFFLVIPVRGDR